MTERTPEQTCLAESMLAKDKIFRAQDALYHFKDAQLGEEVEGILARVRGDLEALDRLLRPFADPRRRPDPAEGDGVDAAD